ncbi:MAG: hypothetical protein Q9183_005180 [Haloplaca sp. 2 TL-2023]
MSSLKQRKTWSGMPDLTAAALPGASIDSKDINEQDRSPTPTPAQTRSASPVRGSIVPHTADEAASFVLKLNDIAEADEAIEAIHTPASPSEHTSKASLRVNKSVPVTTTSVTHTAAPTTQTSTSTAQTASSTTQATKSTVQTSIPATQGSSSTHQTSKYPRSTKATAKASNLILSPLKTARNATVSSMDGSTLHSLAAKVNILVIYFLFSLGLTLYSKEVMIVFKFPFLLTALHCGATYMGTSIMHARGYFTPKILTNQDTAKLSAFSLLYTANVAVSNASLAIVSVPFHQTVRAITPVFTVAIYRLVYGGTYGRATYWSLLPVILGVMLTSYGDMSASTVGFLLTILGAFLAALKTVATNRLQTAGLHLSAVELLHRMSPIACFQSLFVAYLVGEFSRFQPGSMSVTAVLALLGNGAIAFGLNVASFEANGRAGALTMTIAANVKQVLTVALSVVIWDLALGATNALGIALTLVGGALYGRSELVGKKGPSQDLEANLNELEEMEDFGDFDEEEEESTLVE